MAGWSSVDLLGMLKVDRASLHIILYLVVGKPLLELLNNGVARVLGQQLSQEYVRGGGEPGGLQNNEGHSQK